MRVREYFVSFGSKCETVERFRFSLWEISSAPAVTDDTYAN